jgi:hypothetical protein
MRVIIEVDDEQELRETLALLGNRNPIIVEKPPIETRATQLLDALRKYQIKLPVDWKFNRDELYDR